jgi:hypothetical protein
MEFSIRRPVLSIFDPDAKLPLKVDRLDLQVPWRRLTFAPSIIHGAIRDVIAYAITTAPREWALDSEMVKSLFGKSGHPAISPGFIISSHAWGPLSLWFMTDAGIAPLWRSVAASVAPQNILCLPADPDQRQFNFRLERPCPLMLTHWSGADEFSSWIDFTEKQVPLRLGVQNVSAHALVGKNHEKTHSELSAQSAPHCSSPSATCFMTGRSEDFHFELTSLCSDLTNLENAWMMEYRLPATRRAKADALSELWKRYVGTVIPFDPTARKALRDKLHADPDMRPHIEYWESVAAKNSQSDES